MSQGFKKNNHYVAKSYLRRFQSSPGRVWVYRTLVAHDQTPLWREHSISGTGYATHLYTRVVNGQESDEYETWFDREFESPASEALDLATTDRTMRPHHWRALVRYLALHDVRTPARYMQNQRFWDKEGPRLLQQALDNVKERGGPLAADAEALPDTFDGELPIQVRLKPASAHRRARGDDPGQVEGELEAEMLLGRRMWLAGVKRRLELHSSVLHKHRWTILHAPPDLPWFTSDSPVLRLNYMAPGEYDFGGGWDNDGGELLMPLSPQHLLYTRMGMPCPRRGTTVQRAQALEIRRLMAAHASRLVFCAAKDKSIPELRKRRVDAHQFEAEREGWKTWNREQSTAEGAFFPSGSGKKGG